MKTIILFLIGVIFATQYMGAEDLISNMYLAVISGVLIGFSICRWLNDKIT